MIPRSIKLAGMTIRVVFNKELWKKKQIVAEASYTEQLITIDNSVLTEEGIIQSYYHELIHHILFILNEPELRVNEKLVDTIAHLVHQAAQADDRYTWEELKK